MRRAILVLVTLILGCGSAWAQLSVTDKAIIRKTGRLHLDIHYPQTGIPAIDKLLDGRDWAKVSAADLQGATPDQPYSVGVSYEIKRNNAQMFSVQVSSNVYTGGAHGMPDAQSYNFLMPDGAQVLLPELVDGQHGLDRISELAIADLTRQLGTGDLQSIRNGASPHAGSFQNFAWLPEELELTFTPYQVAAYAAGTRTVHIPLSALADVIRPNPRAPVASFDCLVARSRIEKAICSDAELARLDRQVADNFNYDLHVHSLFPPRPDETPMQRRNREVAQGYRDKTIAWQRDWLAKRDKDCANASIACLKASYTAHLRAPRP